MKLQLVFLIATLAAAGCAPRAMVKTQNSAPPAAATPTAVPLPQVPSLVNVHGVVSDADYQQAVQRVAGAEVDRHNTDDFSLIAQYQYNHSDLPNSLKNYQKIALVSDSESDKAQYMVGQIYYDKKDYLPALAAFQNVFQKFPGSSYAAQSRQMMEFLMGYSLNLEDLRSFVTNYPNSPLKCTALFQLGSHEAQAGLQTEAIDHLSAFVQQCGSHPSLSSARLLLQSLEEQQQGKSWKIGVLVPTTGRFKSFGESVLNGITLAMEEANQAGGSRKPMSILVRDTMGDPTQAVKVFQDLSKDGSLDAVIGPVVSSEIASVAPLSNQQRIVLICPSDSRDGLSTLGPYLFSNSMTNEMQGRVIAHYAMDHLGLRRFGMLSPDDGYGQTLSDSFQKTVEAAGGTITASATYPANSTDFKAQLVQLGGQDPGASKENDRENNRRLEELNYNLTKEIGKIFIKAKDVMAASSAPSTTASAVAFVPLVEALGNTAAPSVAKSVNTTVKSVFPSQTQFAIRTDDLVQQSLTLLPVEYRGTTLSATADQWGEVAQDMQATLIITGRIIGTNTPDEPASHSTWDYSISFEAFQLDPVKNTFVKIYQNKVPYSIIKPTALIQANTGFQALYLPAHSGEIPLLASQAHFYNLNPVFLGGHLWENETVRQEGGKDVEGSYFVTGFYVDSQQGSTKKFAEDYLKRFAKRPDLLAAQAYDAAMLLLKATAASANRDDIHNNLLAIKDFDGVSGKTTFGGHGEADKVVPVLKIQGGKLEQVQ